jgi:xylulokinase
MFLGIDLGTSGIKVVVMNSAGEIVSSSTSPLTVSRPQPLWSEQNPADWWQALENCMTELAQSTDLKAVQAIGLSGQMHGATLLDNNNQVIRPAILWNDGRCEAQCKEIEAAVDKAREICGNIVMPGFTAPKLLWVKQYEPENFSRVCKVLLPKDYLRFKLSGDFASDMSDSAGTAWLDVGKRDWNDDLLASCGLTRSQMPALYEGSDITGHLDAKLAGKWGMNPVPIVAGAGDNAAGAIGVGIVNAGQAMLSLGTSGVYFAVGDGYFSNPESAVHSFCHALPKSWHLMSVILSAASCLQWYADSIAKADVAELLAELDSAEIDVANNCIFLPYLSGERTPHNNPNAQGAFVGITHSTDRAAMTHAVLEGVSFAFADGAKSLHGAGLEPTDITLIGGGSRSPYWRQMLADVLNQKLSFRRGGEVGPALGAARLAQLGIQADKSLAEICPVPPLEQEHLPNNEKHLIYNERLQKYRKLYESLKDSF